MKKLKLLYAFAWLVPVALFTCVYLEVVGSVAGAAHGGVVDYIMYLFAVAVTLIVAYVSIKFFAMSTVKKRLPAEDSPSYAEAYLSLSVFRMCLLLFAEVVDAVVLVATEDKSVIYLMAILTLVLFFCVPQSRQVRSTQTDNH